MIDISLNIYSYISVCYCNFSFDVNSGTCLLMILLIIPCFFDLGKNCFRACGGTVAAIIHSIFETNSSFHVR